MKPLLLMERVGVNETMAEKAVRRGVALRAFLRCLRKAGMTTVCQVEARQFAGLTREEIAKDLCLHLRDMPELESRAAQRRWDRDGQQRLRQAFAAE